MDRVNDTSAVLDLSLLSVEGTPLDSARAYPELVSLQGKTVSGASACEVRVTHPAVVVHVFQELCQYQSVVKS